MKLKRIAFYLYVALLGIIMIFFVKLNSDEIVEKYTYTFAIAFGLANRVLKKIDKYGLLTDILIDSLNL